MKDPAFLFYSDNFLSGTMFFTDEQTGKYIRLLCAQHLTGHLEEKHMILICKGHDEDIWKKFIKDDKGLFYNERLEIEILRRKNYSESRANNKKGKTKKGKNTSKSYDNHMGNGNGIGNELLNIDSLKEIIEYLNNKSGKNFKTSSEKTKKCINARINEGYVIEDFKKVIDTKVSKWLNDSKMSDYLRPETLFGTKFESYLNETKVNGHNSKPKQQTMQEAYNG